jgi:hypothetical protein
MRRKWNESRRSGMTRRGVWREKREEGGKEGEKGREKRREKMNHRRLRGKCSDVNHSEKARGEEESKVSGSGRDRGCETDGKSGRECERREGGDGRRTVNHNHNDES